MIIAHRINRIERLERTPVRFGVEVDVRSSGRDLILRHEPGANGVRFADYLRRYRHRFLVANVKCDGIEIETVRLLRRHRVRDFFLVDLAMPAIVRLVAAGERRFAARLSEFESAESVAVLRGKAEWVWIDGFTRWPAFGPRARRVLRGFRRCLVSPELHGRGVDVRTARRLSRRYGAVAVCTDVPGTWEDAGFP